MIKCDAVVGVEDVVQGEFICKGCLYGKSHRMPSRQAGVDIMNFTKGECIHVNLCGKMSTSLNGAEYFMLIKGTSRC